MIYRDPKIVENMELRGGVYVAKGTWGAKNGCHFNTPAPKPGQTVQCRRFIYTAAIDVIDNVKSWRWWTGDIGALPNGYIGTPKAQDLVNHPWELYTELANRGRKQPQFFQPGFAYPFGDARWRRDLLTITFPSDFGKDDGSVTLSLDDIIVFKSDGFICEGPGIDRQGKPTILKGLPTWWSFQMNINRPAPAGAIFKQGLCEVEFF